MAICSFRPCSASGPVHKLKIEKFKNVILYFDCYIFVVVYDAHGLAFLLDSHVGGVLDLYHGGLLVARATTLIGSEAMAHPYNRSRRSASSPPLIQAAQLQSAQSGVQTTAPLDII